MTWLCKLIDERLMFDKTDEIDDWFKHHAQVGAEQVIGDIQNWSLWVDGKARPISKRVNGKLVMHMALPRVTEAEGD